MSSLVNSSTPAPQDSSAQPRAAAVHIDFVWCEDAQPGRLCHTSNGRADQLLSVEIFPAETEKATFISERGL